MTPTPSVQTLEPRRSFGEFTLDLADERLIGSGGPVKLGNKAFQVLRMLSEQDGLLLTKDALFSSVWDGMIVSESSLTSVIKELRRALGDESRKPRYIESVYGRGYRLIPPVRSDEAGTPGGAPGQERDAAAPTGQPPLVLVSEFNDEAVRTSHPYCASAIREEILSGLARVREIRLVADDGLRQPQPGEASYQLTATLLPDGQAVKVIARAKRLDDGRIVWAETMPLSGAGGTAEGVERIVRRIVAAALPAVDDDIFLGLPAEPGDLYDAYLVAKRLSFTAASFEEADGARRELERIIARQPDFGLAYPPLVRLYNTDFNWTALGRTAEKERAEALSLAKRGLAADRGNANAHSALGWCHVWHRQRGQALRCFDQALALNPYNRVRVQEAATALLFLDDLARSRELIARALDLDPVPDDDISEEMARLELVCGRYDSALQWLERIVEPTTIWMELYLGACETALHRAGAAERIRQWRSKVEARWHDGRVPDNAELLSWVRRHHPLPAEKDKLFFTPVEAAIRAAAEAG